MSLKLPGETPRKKQKERRFKPCSKKPYSRVKMSKNRQEIHDVANKAKEMGMSYGEYVTRFCNEL